MAVNEQAIAVAANQFVATRPDFAEYNTVANSVPMAQRIVDTWGEAGLENASCWEIIFLEMRDALTKNPDFVSPEFRRRANSISVDEMKRAYRNEPGFAEQWSRLSRADVPAASLSNDPYASLTVEQLRSIPANTRAQKQAQEPMFQAAVERLAAIHGQL